MRKTAEKIKEERLEFYKTHSVSECAKEWKMTLSGACIFIKRNLPKKREKKKRQFDNEERLEFFKNHTVSECAEEWGVTRNSVYYWMYKNDLKPKKTRKQFSTMKELLELIPVYPEMIPTREVKWLYNLPSDALLCEDNHKICWLNQEAKDKWLKANKGCE